MKDIQGKAILDYYKGNESATLLIHNNYDDPEEMPVEVFFRESEDLSTLEHLALIECEGSVLDLGAGAGVHTLILQERGFEVTALDNSPGSVEVMKRSGVKNCQLADFNSHHKKYNTILCLMNGLGLAGKLNQLPRFLQKCMTLLSPNGKLLVDSSDISYLYEDGLAAPSDYFGEVRYQYEYKGEKGEWFDWLYVDQDTLSSVVHSLNLKIEILHTDENDQYLACISR